MAWDCWAIQVSNNRIGRLRVLTVEDLGHRKEATKTWSADSGCLNLSAYLDGVLGACSFRPSRPTVALQNATD